MKSKSLSFWFAISVILRLLIELRKWCWPCLGYWYRYWLGKMFVVLGQIRFNVDLLSSFSVLFIPSTFFQNVWSVSLCILVHSLTMCVFEKKYVDVKCLYVLNLTSHSASNGITAYFHVHQFNHQIIIIKDIAEVTHPKTSLVGSVRPGCFQSYRVMQLCRSLYSRACRRHINWTARRTN